MDKPVTPAEELADALSSLVLALDRLREALDVACEILAAGDQAPDTIPSHPAQ